jgi:hypothetical protein
VRKYIVLIGFIFFGCLSAQEDNAVRVDSLYKEDQFYAGVTYNLLGKKPTNLKQNGFSLGFHAGFIKDMPINKDRNIAIGIGLGYSVNSFNHNLLIVKDDLGNIDYSIIDKSTISFSKNKFSQHLIELPLEYRWRTSSPTNYNFWRVYAGFKIGYVLSNATKFKGSLGELKHHNIEDFNKFQYGLTVSMGYNTWNLYLYYALNPIFSNTADLNGDSLDMNAVKIGLMFYVL